MFHQRKSRWENIFQQFLQAASETKRFKLVGNLIGKIHYCKLTVKLREKTASVCHSLITFDLANNMMKSCCIYRSGKLPQVARTYVHNMKSSQCVNHLKVFSTEFWANHTMLQQSLV